LTIYIILLVLLTLASLWAVIKGSLVKSAITLAVVSVILSIIMFKLDSPLAAVFELSVCAGLITVIFMSTISLTKPMTPFEAKISYTDRVKRYWRLPVILVIAAIVLIKLDIKWDKYLMKQSPAISTEKVITCHGEEEAVELDTQHEGKDVRHIMWNKRRIDILGQVIVLLVGVFAVVVLFKYSPDNLSDPEIKEEKNV